MMKGVDPGAGERRAFQNPVQQPGKIWKDRLIHPLQGIAELAVILKAHEEVGYHALFKAW